MKLKELLSSLLDDMRLASPDRADEQTHGPFTVTVPDGWTVTYLDARTAKDAALYLDKGSSSQVGFVLTSLSGDTFTEFITYMMENPEPGSGMPREQDDGSWLVSVFDAETKEKAVERYSSVGNGAFALCILTKGHDSAVDGILKSFKLDPAAEF